MKGSRLGWVMDCTWLSCTLSSNQQNLETTEPDCCSASKNTSDVTWEWWYPGCAPQRSIKVWNIWSKYEKNTSKSQNILLWSGDSYPKVKPRHPDGSRVTAYKSRQCFFPFSYKSGLICCTWNETDDLITFDLMFTWTVGCLCRFLQQLQLLRSFRHILMAQNN